MSLGNVQNYTLQTHRVYYTLKQRGNGRFHVFSTWNTRGVSYLRGTQKEIFLVILESFTVLKEGQGVQ